MSSLLTAFGIISVFLLIGILLRGSVQWIQKMLIPATVIGGILGFVLFNLIPQVSFLPTTEDYSKIVDSFFILSFISIGLSSTPGARKKKKKSENKEQRELEKNSTVWKGAWDLGLVWCFLFAFTAGLGILIIALIGKPFHMDPIYGVLIPFGFCQGPGPSVTYGKLFEQSYGYANAQTVALSFAAVGFLIAFLVGVPLARFGLRRGYTKAGGTLSGSVARGFYKNGEQRESLGQTTTHSGSIETIAAHFVFIGISYLIAIGFAALVKPIPVLGETLAALVYFWGMVAAVIIKWVLTKLHLDYLIDNNFQSRLTGFFSDYLVVASFLAIRVKIISRFLVPILILSLIVAAITYFTSVWFGARFGSDHDFERTLGLFGICTGTAPSGICLVRIVDPTLKTSAGLEVGMMNLTMFLYIPALLIITFAGLGKLSPILSALILVGISVLYLGVLFLTKGVSRHKSFTFGPAKKKEKVPATKGEQLV